MDFPAPMTTTFEVAAVCVACEETTMLECGVYPRKIAGLSCLSDLWTQRIAKSEEIRENAGRNRLSQKQLQSRQ